MGWRWSRSRWRNGEDKRERVRGRERGRRELELEFESFVGENRATRKTPTTLSFSIGSSLSREASMGLIRMRGRRSRREGLASAQRGSQRCLDATPGWVRRGPDSTSQRGGEKRKEARGESSPKRMPPLSLDRQFATPSSPSSALLSASPQLKKSKTHSSLGLRAARDTERDWKGKAELGILAPVFFSLIFFFVVVIGVSSSRWGERLFCWRKC